MREKKRYLVITFQTTTQAMAMEDFCCSNDLPGRLIPLPGKIAAGCGLCWRAEATQKSILCERILKQKLHWEAMYDIEM